MNTKSMRTINEQLERLDDSNERRNNIICAIARKYVENIINHFGGYKDEIEFIQIYYKEVAREIYAGY